MNIESRTLVLFFFCFSFYFMNNIMGKCVSHRDVLYFVNVIFVD